MKKVDTLRVSVTDRCNLRCVYCMPPGGVERIDHREILTFEEIERVARVAIAAGVAKVRVTGGEPLVRKDIVDLIGRLSKLPGLADLPMTTNGVLLKGMAPALKKAGLSRVTVSMDTLDRTRYKEIAGSDRLAQVMDGIEAALSHGLAPVKVNVVAVPGENDGEAVDFARLAERLGIEVRFIERMPLRRSKAKTRCGMASDSYVPAAEIRARIERELGAMTAAREDTIGRPARVFDLPGGRGKIGFISPMTEPFCKWCSRMRLTPDGKLRGCLASDSEIDVKGPMRAGKDDAELARLFNLAVAEKPDQDAACFGASQRPMSRIGG